MEYKRLGDYIREVNVRNRDEKVTKPMGINIDKHFMPSVANVIGTDLSAYKLVSKNQFACNLMHVGRDEKIPMAMQTDDNPIIVSPAYFVFEITQSETLIPEYLMMWFSRPEFDRNAWFYTDADVRGGMDKNAFMDMVLPIPSIERQREIVEEYKTLTNRIILNKQMIQHLEATAQTLFRKMFVDNIDKENLPDGWRMGTLEEICEINTISVPSNNKQKIRYLDSGSVTNNVFDRYQILEPLVDEIPSRAKRKVLNNDILYSTVRPNLLHYGIIMDPNVDDIVVSTGFAVIRSIDTRFSNELLYLILTDANNTEALQSIAEMSKATYPSITPDNIMAIKFAISNDFEMICNSLNQQLIVLNKTAYLYKQEIVKIKELQLLLLAKMRNLKQ